MSLQNNQEKIKDLYWGVSANGLMTIIVVILIISMASNDAPYFQWGPSSKLFYVSVRIDTWTKYIAIQLWIAIQKIIDVYINELTSPILGFSVYNPDQVHITWISKMKLQVLANIMFGCNSLRKAFTIVVAVTQIDFTLCAMVAGEFTSLVTIRKLLNRKNFDGIEDETEIMMKDCERRIEQEKETSNVVLWQKVIAIEKIIQEMKTPT